MKTTTGTVTIAQILDGTPLGGFRARAMILCALVALLDGFDTQAIAFVAPTIAKQWGVEPAAFGLVFGAGLLGLTIGSLVLGPTADMLGRRFVILWSTATFGAFALLTPLADSIETLALLRFLTGLGLGGAVPNIIALTSEYAPSRMRATLVTAMYCGFPLGAVLGGLISAPIIANYGWASIFILGGVLPLLLAVVLWKALPESVRFLHQHTKDRMQVVTLLARIDQSLPRDTRIAQADEERPGQSRRPVWDLLTGGRAVVTLLLWTVFFANLLTLYFLVNWLPSLLIQMMLPTDQAILSIALLNGAGIVGGLAIGWLIDRRSPLLALGLGYTFAALAILGIALAGDQISLVMVAIALAGLFVIGTQFGMNALATTFYPTSMRSAGVGWAIGVGRMGSILGPVLGGLLLANGWQVRELLTVAAVPSAVAAAMICLLAIIRPKSGRPSQRVSQAAIS